MRIKSTYEENTPGLDQVVKFEATDPGMSLEQHNYYAVEMITHVARAVLMKVKSKLGKDVIFTPTNTEDFNRVSLKTDLVIYDIISQNIYKKAGKENE